MKSKKIAILIIAILILTSFRFTAYAEDIIFINSLDDFLMLAVNVNSGNDYAGKSVVLNVNMDFNGVVWVPIGSKDKPFNGKFDGKGFTINNLTLPLYNGDAQYAYVGLFGYVGCYGKINNITVNCVDDVAFRVAADSKLYYGNLVGYNEGSIDDCYTSGDIMIKHTQSTGYIGGVCGYNNGIISDSQYCESEKEWPYNLYVIGWDYHYDLYSDSCVGGICGSNHGIIINCKSTCSINAANAFASCSVGGIAGDNKGEISYCSSRAFIKGRGLFALNSGYVYAGGVCGSNNGTLGYCYSTSKVVVCIESGDNENGKRMVTCDGGGVCGYNNGQINDCYSSGGFEVTGYTDVSIAAITNVGGLCGYNSGSISESYADGGTVKETLNTAGGLCGYNKSGIIKNCYVENLTVKAAAWESRTKYCGGIVGVNEAGNIFMSYSKAKILADNNKMVYGGGISGFNDNGNIDSCYFIGSGVTSGIAGGICGKNKGTIFCSYVSTVITAATSNAVVGENYGMVYECYYPDTISAANNIGVPKSIIQLQSESTYEKWDFDFIWTIDGTTNLGLPHFREDAVVSFKFGNGTSQSPFLIYTEGDLRKIRYTKGAYFRLASDIVLSDVWFPIGSVNNAFSGFFDGNGFVISEVNIPKSYSNANSGLFGYCENISIKNLYIKTSLEGEICAAVTSSDLNDRAYSGGIVGFANNGVIENCRFEGTVKAEGITAYAGGIVGYINGSVQGCTSSGTVKSISTHNIGNTYCGGIAGCAMGLIGESSSDCDIFCENSANIPVVKLGGIAGNMVGTLEFCSSGGNNLIALNNSNYKTVYIGGVAGNVDGSISYSYSEQVTNYGNPKGGAVGSLYNGSWRNLYFNNLSYDNGIGTAKSQEEMQTGEFLKQLGNADKYIWLNTSDGKFIPLNIKVDRENENGVMSMSLTANGYADIYYTLDESDPRTNGVLYVEPFLCFDSKTIKFCVKTSDGKQSTVFEVYNDYEFTAEENTIYFLESPRNLGDNSIITPSNIKSAQKISVKLKSTFESDEIYIYLAAYDEKGGLSATDVIKTRVIIGENKVEFDKIQEMKDNAVKWKMFVWDKNIMPKSKKALEI